MNYCQKIKLTHYPATFCLAGEGGHVYHGRLRMSTLQDIGIIVGVVTGMSALVLGIRNDRRQRNANRPNVVVRPRVGPVNPLKPTEGPIGVMKVLNKGGVPAINWTFGFLPRRRHEKEIPLAWPSMVAVQLGYELKPHQPAELSFDLQRLPDKLGRAFVRTEVGEVFKASRRDMLEFAKQRKTAGQRKAPSA